MFSGNGVRHVGCGGPAVPAVGLQRGMDLWGDDAVFCQITLTSCSTLCWFTEIAMYAIIPVVEVYRTNVKAQ